MEKMGKGKGKTKRQTLRPFCGHGRGLRVRLRLALGIFATVDLRSKVGGAIGSGLCDGGKLAPTLPFICEMKNFTPT